MKKKYLPFYYEIFVKINFTKKFKCNKQEILSHYIIYRIKWHLYISLDPDEEKNNTF